MRDLTAPAQCNRCRFWRMDLTTIDPLDSDWGFGDCRRNPPVLIDSMIAAEIVPPRFGNQSDLERPCPASAYSASLWPALFATDWCGAFESGVV